MIILRVFQLQECSEILPTSWPWNSPFNPSVRLEGYPRVDHQLPISASDRPHYPQQTPWSLWRLRWLNSVESWRMGSTVLQNLLMVRKRVVFFFESPLNLNPWMFLEKKPELLLIHRVASLVHFTHTCHCIQIILWHHFSSIFKFLMGNPL